MPVRKRYTSSPWPYRSGIVGTGASFRRYSARVAEPIARPVLVTGNDAAAVGRAVVDQLASPALKIAFVFADSRLDPAALVGELRALAAPVVGCTAVGVIGPDGMAGPAPAVSALGLYGDWVRAGVGIAGELSKSPLSRGRDAVHQAALALGTTADALDPGRHIAITLVDGQYRHEEAFCIGSAAAAPQIRFIGGGASIAVEPDRDRRTYLWAGGQVLSDAALAIVIDSDQPFAAVTSSHLVPTAIKTVVTAATGRTIDELDGRPAAARLRRLIAGIGDALDEPRPLHAFARYIDGVPYVRSLHRLVDDRLVLSAAVETGHILHVMRPGDLIRTMKRDLAAAADRVGGAMAALLAFSCMSRHAEAAARGTERELSATFAAYPTIGFQSMSEQSGMLQVNHTLTGLAIGALKS